MTLPGQAFSEIRLALEDVEAQTVNSYGRTEPRATYQTIAESGLLVGALGQALGEPVVRTDPVRLSRERGFGGHEVLEAGKRIAFALEKAVSLEGTFRDIARWLSLGDRRKATLRWSTADGEMQLDLSGYTEEGAIALVRTLLESGALPAKTAATASKGPARKSADAGRHWDIYLSHARKDGAISARELHDHLRRLKPDVTVFLDALVLGLGDDWDIELKNALEVSRLIAVLISEASEQAHYQREEVRIAIDRSRNDSSVRVIPISLDDTVDTLFGLGVKQGISVKQAGGLEVVARELLRV